MPVPARQVPVAGDCARKLQLESIASTSTSRSNGRPRASQSSSSLPSVGTRRCTFAITGEKSRAVPSG